MSKPIRNVPITPGLIERFWSKVDRAGADECWEWRGEKHTHGYGIYSEWEDNRRSVKTYAHRLSLRIAGVDPGSRVVRHDCDNPPCVNPSHLRTGTQAENIQDAVERGRLNLDGLRNATTKTCIVCGKAFLGVPSRRYCDDDRVWNGSQWVGRPAKEAAA